MILPRGLRNNNAGNLRRTGIPWHGELIGHKADWPSLIPPHVDGDFEQFEHAVFGIRAMARTLMGYQARRGLTSIRTMVTRYAPPAENATHNYVAQVAHEVNHLTDSAFLVVAPPLVISFQQANLEALIAAMIRVENGQQPYSRLLIREGVTLALLKEI